MTGVGMRVELLRGGGGATVRVKVGEPTLLHRNADLRGSCRSGGH